MLERKDTATTKHARTATDPHKKKQKWCEGRVDGRAKTKHAHTAADPHQKKQKCCEGKVDDRAKHVLRVANGARRLEGWDTFIPPWLVWYIYRLLLAGIANGTARYQTIWIARGRGWTPAGPPEIRGGDFPHFA